METILHLEHGPMVLQNLLLHLHQLRHGFMESEELRGNLFFLGKKKDHNPVCFTPEGLHFVLMFLSVWTHTENFIIQTLNLGTFNLLFNKTYNATYMEHWLPV